MKVRTEKIAGGEVLELLFSRNRDEFWYVSTARSPLLEIVEQNVPPSHRLILASSGKTPLFLDETALAKHTSMASLLKDRKIGAFFLSNRSNRWLERWAKQHKLLLLTAGAQVQNRLENKISFHRLASRWGFLLPPGGVVPRGAVKNLGDVPGVLQAAEGHGAQRTFIIRRRSEIVQCLKRQRVRPPFLYRRYLAGLPLGISLVISKRDVIFSSLRMQCSLTEKAQSNFYYGVQWIRTTSLPARTLRSIEQMLSKLAHALREEGFLGVANIDLLVYKDGVYLLECNPRLSGATTDLSRCPELLHGLDFCMEYIRALRGERLSLSRNKIPRSSFEGTVLDLDFFMSKLARLTGRKYTPPRAGVYEIKGGKARFFSEELIEFEGTDRIFFCPVEERGPWHPEKMSLGFVLLNQPLFRVTRRGAELTLHKRKIIEQLARQFCGMKGVR